MGLVDKISCICIDKRQRDHNNNGIIISLENGKKIGLPPNIQSVPALLRVSKNYTVLFGDKQITEYLAQQYAAQHPTSEILAINGEPGGYAFNGSGGGSFTSNISSEKFTNYNMSPEELNSKGTSKSRELYNYVPATHEMGPIQAPPDTYKPDKIPSNLTLDVIQQKRMADVQQNGALNI
jgi:arylsulfatase A-like enzyme